MSALGWATLGAQALGGLFGGMSQSQDKATSRASGAMGAARQLETQPLRQQILALLGQNVGQNVPRRFEAWGGQPAGYDRSMFQLSPTFQPDNTSINVYNEILDKLGYKTQKRPTPGSAPLGPGAGGAQPGTIVNGLGGQGQFPGQDWLTMSGLGGTPWGRRP